MCERRSNLLYLQTKAYGSRVEHGRKNITRNERVNVNLNLCGVCFRWDNNLCWCSLHYERGRVSILERRFLFQHEGSAILYDFFRRNMKKHLVAPVYLREQRIYNVGYTFNLHLCFIRWNEAAKYFYFFRAAGEATAPSRVLQ